MYSDMISCRCSIVRGGTSKAVFIKENELPSDPMLRDHLILSIFGGVDLRQIDGLGGADVLTSKLAIVGPPTHPDADVDYTFGQVSFERPFVDYGGNCGNISAAVGPYAIDEGLVRAVEPLTTVRIHCTNSGRLLTATVPVKNGKALVSGDCAISGVNGSGARIDMDWTDMAGATCGNLLPTGNVKDEIVVEGSHYEVSLVDMGNPLVFISAQSLGMFGTESPAEIEANRVLMERIEKIRCQCAKLFGLVEVPEEATAKSPYNPFFAIVSKPAEYRTINGSTISQTDVDMNSRLIFMQRTHKAYPITGTVCTGVACRIPGTVAWDCVPENLRQNLTVRIGHPGGTIPVEVAVDATQANVRVQSVKVYRTARRIMDGIVYVKK